MSAIDNSGGPAFPRPPVLHGDSNRVLFPGQTGMSLRDWFAGQALTGIVAASTGVTEEHLPMVAEAAYAMADAMMAARAVKPSES